MLVDRFRIDAFEVKGKIPALVPIESIGVMRRRCIRTAHFGTSGTLDAKYLQQPVAAADPQLRQEPTPELS